MKNKFLIVFAILYTMICFGQVTTIEELGVQLSLNSRGESLSKTEGSPFINKSFMNAKVGDINAKMRYNALDDTFEFLTSTNDTLALSKNKSYNNITFSDPKLDYYMLDYTEKDGSANTGYLIKLLEKNSLILYKKQKVKYYPATAARNSYLPGTPAKFGLLSDAFFLKNKAGQITEFPTGKKGVLKLFPEMKTELEAFIKQNSIDLDKESDLIKLIEFLAQ